MGVLDIVKPGVLSGDDVTKLYAYAKEQGFAIPAVNVVGSDSVNAVLEAAKVANSPVIVQFSNGGAGFYAGKACENAAVLGAIAGAKHVHLLAQAYGVPVILHTDHAARKLLPWIDELVKASHEYKKTHGVPLFSSHMLDLSEENINENLSTCEKYLKELSELGISLEIELGVTGGEEDGVDNTSVDNALLYTQPEDVALAYERLSKISDKFSIAASFGNVHGVYKPGNVVLRLKDIKNAVSYGVIKMNIDTDTQWAFWDGVREYEAKNRAYLQGQIGNPEGDDKPNKKYYDPRKWLRSGEESMVKRLQTAFSDLNCLNRN